MSTQPPVKSKRREVPNHPALSVVIPTTRPRFIRDTLDALAAQTRPQLEVVVVENGVRTDGLEGLLAEFSGRLTVQYVYTPDEGLNLARNVGVKASTADIIALTDDDCVPAADWAEQLLAVHELFPDAGVVGGRVDLKFLAPRPGWLVGEFRKNLSEVRLADEIHEVRPDQYVAGANLSFRRRVFDAVGGFHETLGLVGRAPPQLVHDEKLFVRKARSLGRPGAVYASHAAVDHQIPGDRLTIDYHEHRRYGLGVSDIELRYLSEDRIDRAAMLRWFMRAVDNQRGVVAKARREFGARLHENELDAYQGNLFRARVAYASGLQDRLLDRYRPGGIRAELEGGELRFYRAGIRAILSCCGRGMSRRLVLDHAVGSFTRERACVASASEADVQTVHRRIAFWKGLRDAMPEH